MTSVVTKAAGEDIDKLYVCFSHYRHELGFDKTSNDIRLYLQQLIAEQHVYIVNYLDKVIGFAICESASSSSLIGKRLEIIDLWVDPSYRNAGIGKQMVEKIKHIAAINRYVCIDLVSESSNCAAHRFFERIGFKPLSLNYFRLRTS